MTLRKEHTDFSQLQVEETNFTLPILEILSVNGGPLTTTKIKKEVKSIMTFSKEDLELRSLAGSTRNEAYWKQKLGNIVSNRNANKPNIIKDGYVNYDDKSRQWTITEKGASFLNQHKR